MLDRRQPAARLAPPEAADAIVDAGGLPEREDPATPRVSPAVRPDIPKAAAGSSAQLFIGARQARVGDDRPIKVLVSDDTEISVCVDGPEPGRLFSGFVTPNHPDLPGARAGTSMRYVFDMPGNYIFKLAAGDDPTCKNPTFLQTVSVEP